MENKLSFFFRHQIWHVGGTIILFYIGSQFVDLDSNTNTFLEISALNWFIIAMAIPLVHQVYTWICWRSELCWKTVSSSIGLKAVIFDLGYSLNQILDFKKGLSFQSTGKLDMRLGLNQFSCDDVISNISEKSLNKIFKIFGEEKNSKLIARRIIQNRNKNKLNRCPNMGSKIDW